MPSYYYQAVNPNGKLVKGVLDADDEAAVVEWLQRQGMIPVRAEVERHGFRLDTLLSFEKRHRTSLSKNDIAQFTRELAVMLAAGQDLDRALRFLTETTPSHRLREMADALRERLRGGASLAAALSAYPESFSPMYLGLVRAGEAGGTLAQSLDHLGTLLERDRALAQSVQSAMLYPAILVVAAFASVALLLTKVLPQFVPFFTQSGARLPWSTQFLIDLGDSMTVVGPWCLVLILGGVALTKRMLSLPHYRLAADRLVLKMPVIGRLLRESLAARFSRTLGTLLKNGVPLVNALGIVEGALGNLEAEAVVAAATSKVKTGNGLAASLEIGALFPPRCLHLLRLGEETAQLGEMALKAADIHDGLVRQQVHHLVTLMVPAITIVMGAVVAGIVASLLSAMLSLNELVM